MSLDRRLDPERVIIDDILFFRASGSHTRTCVICGTTLIAGEERYAPIRRARGKLVDGRRTRICGPCVDERLSPASARGAA